MISTRISSSLAAAIVVSAPALAELPAKNDMEVAVEKRCAAFFSGSEPVKMCVEAERAKFAEFAALWEGGDDETRKGYDVCSRKTLKKAKPNFPFIWTMALSCAKDKARGVNS